MIVRGRHRKRRLGTSHDIALDLDSDAVTLFWRPAGEDWQPHARAELGSAAFSQEIDELRVEATVRGAKSNAVLFWLPEDQILVRQYLLHERGLDAEAEARRRLASETSYRSEELAIALGPSRRGEPTPVLAALTQTVREAGEYARRWGFPTSVVSTRVGLELFGGTTPIFKLPEPRARRAARVSLRAVAASLIGILVGVGGYTALTSVEPLFDSVEPNDATGPIFASVQIYDDAPGSGPAALDLVRVGHAQGLALRRLSVDQASGRGISWLATYGGAPATIEPAALRAPSRGPKLKIGAASGLPQKSRPGRLEQAASATSRGNVEATLAAINKLRADGLVTPSQEDSDVADTETNSPESEGLVLAALPTEKDTLFIEPIRRKPDEARSTEPEASSTPEDDLAPTAFAPVEIDISPLAKPTPPAEPEPAQETTAAAAPETRPNVAPTAPAEPEPASSETAEPEETEEPTIYAALSAPKPLARPRGLVVAQTSRPTEPIRSFAPRSVRDAASQSGLALNQTSLIGIFDVQSGRHALVRLPTGTYQKVARGDMLDGWRVNSITREALRLSKQGQNRTLLLVSR